MAKRSPVLHFNYVVNPNPLALCHCITQAEPERVIPGNIHVLNRDTHKFLEAKGERGQVHHDEKVLISDSPLNRIFQQAHLLIWVINHNQVRVATSTVGPALVPVLLNTGFSGGKEVAG